MSIFFRSRPQQQRGLEALADLIPGRVTSATAATVTRDTSMQSSVKWACQRLRADLVSTTPLDVFRRVNGVQVEAPKPPVLVSPGGPEMDLAEWLYSTQFDLDDCGNAFGVVRRRNQAGLPDVIELVPAASVIVRVTGGVPSYSVDGTEVPVSDMWHERQFTVPGSPVGLSPTAYAVLSLSGYLSAAQFAADWFSGSAIPAAMLKNSAKVLTGDQATAVKARFKDTVANGDVFVAGADWDYSIIGAKGNEAAFDAAMKLSASDICRFYGVPGDLVDVETSGGSITYANVTQRNLQLLILNMGPAFVRRERVFSNRLLPRGRYAKFNTDALLRMDPAQRMAMHAQAITSRILTPSEARELENRPPLTAEQEDEFARLFPAKSTPTSPITGGN